jgi:hypothetical protein
MAFHSMVTMGSNNNKRTSEWKCGGREAREFCFTSFRAPGVFRAGFHFVRVTLNHAKA